MEIGTASAEPGTRSQGWIEVADLPTGGTERLPVVIVAGEREGPTLWITASIHGDEVTPLAAAQDLARSVPAGELQGTLVCVPIANPAGLRLMNRRSYYHRDDPNRFFPALDREGTLEGEDRSRPPRTQEEIDRRLYDAIAGSADALCDLHTAGIGSMAYTIRDQVLFGAERDRAAAEKLDDALNDLIEAIGLPVVNEFPVPEYFERNFHRTLSGSALNSLGVPAATIELGGHTVVDETIREVALGGLYRVLAALDMLDAPDTLDTAEALDTADVSDTLDAFDTSNTLDASNASGAFEASESAPGAAVSAAAAPTAAPVSYPVKRHDGPRVSSTGIVRHRASAGEAVAAGEPVAEVLTPHGERKEVVESEHDGYVLARKPGVAVYANDAICSMAVRDDSDRVVARNG
jgi:predicted deacylase